MNTYFSLINASLTSGVKKLDLKLVIEEVSEAAEIIFIIEVSKVIILLKP